MGDVVVREDYQLVLTKREFTLVTKALVGKLDPERDVSEARVLGVDLMCRAVESLKSKQTAMAHATERATDDG